MNISERIFIVMKQKKVSQTELSRRTGISVKNISDWKRKKTNPNSESLLPICNALEISPNQLLTGKGIDPDYIEYEIEYEMSPADMKILKQIHSLSEEQYTRLLNYLKALQEIEELEKFVVK